MRRPFLTLVALAALAGGTAARAATAAASGPAFPASLELVGHGWGHGRGMGQYGALGYALQGHSYKWILAHYYGGTVLTTTATRTINVNLEELAGVSSVTVAARPGAVLLLDGKTIPSPARIEAGSTDHSITSKAGDSWSDVIVSGPWSGSSQRSFAGAIIVKSRSAGQIWNTVPLEDYVEGVVPRESPASWPLAALEAQAVAARSYALASIASSRSTICDTTWCQVYGGDPTQYGPNSETYYSNSDDAVLKTAGEVLDCGGDRACGTPSQVALTEFSSSTGGYTAGGMFPAVVDAGDATASNPNHDWQVSVPSREIAAAYPSVGALRSVTVTARNGLGDYGGRVTEMVIRGSAGHVTVTGADFAAAVGLMSNWFEIVNPNPAAGSDRGYWVVSSAGGVYPFGNAPDFGSMVGKSLNAPVLGMAPTADAKGYWLVASDGGIFSFGHAKFYGSTGDIKLNKPIFAMASTADGKGYWMVASDGGIFSFGDAKFYGSTGGRSLAAPIIGMATTPNGKGYWLVGANGAVYPFGDAKFYGSAAGWKLNQPVVGMVRTGDGRGYWLIAADGGIFTFGDAHFVGSLPGIGVSDTVVSVSPTPDGRGYLMIGSSGNVYPFGDASFLGDPASGGAGWSGQARGIFVDAG